MSALKLVLADGPTDKFDPVNGRQVLQLFRKQVKELSAAAILVSRSEAAVAGCGRRYRLPSEGLREVE